MRGADRLVKALADMGVQRIFTLSGHQILAIYDACLTRGIEVLHVRHEAAAVLMADAHAQLSGSIGVAVVSAGPGMANAAGALYAARLQESPVLLISGDTPWTEHGRGSFQALDQVGMTAAQTKSSRLVTVAESLESEVALAARIALSGRPGPVHLAIPVDVLEAAAEAPYEAVRLRKRSLNPHFGEVGMVANRLRRAERPLILTGPALNATRAPALHHACAASFGTPVVALESPRGLNDPANGRLARLLSQADLVLALGKTIDFRAGFARPSLTEAAWIVVDSEEDALALAQRNVRPDRLDTIAADPRRFAELLFTGADPSRLGPWRRRASELLTARSYDDVPNGRTGAITPFEVSAAIGERIAASDDAIFICDGGEFGQWAQAVVTGARRRIINGPSANIGPSIPYAIAARKHAPDALIYAAVGDGGIGFHLAEFETAARLGTPFVAVVGNNLSWYAEQHVQASMFGRNRIVGCDLSPARYHRAVEALGGFGEHVTTRAELGPALERAERSGLPACVMVDIAPTAAP